MVARVIRYKEPLGWSPLRVRNERCDIASSVFSHLSPPQPLAQNTIRRRVIIIMKRKITPLKKVDHASIVRLLEKPMRVCKWERGRREEGLMRTQFWSPGEFWQIFDIRSLAVQGTFNSQSIPSSKEWSHKQQLRKLDLIKQKDLDNEKDACAHADKTNYIETCRWKWFIYHFEHVRSYDFIYCYDGVVDKNNAFRSKISVLVIEWWVMFCGP